MRSVYRSWLLLPVLLMSLMLVVAACDDGGDDEDAEETDDTEQVEDSDEGESEDEATEEEGSETEEESTEEQGSESDDAAAEDEDEEDSADDSEDDGESTVGEAEVTDANEELGGPVVFGDFNWDSAAFHNRVVQYILEEGYGHETDSMNGSTQPMLQGMRDNDIHIVTEMWVQNMPEEYHEDVEEGVYVDLGANYIEAVQGWFVPTYVIEGDEERGIEPMAPDLESVDQLADYWEVFEDEEDPEKGRVYNGIGGWEATEHNNVRLRSYGLDEYYNSFLPGSEAALFTSLARAYERGDAWIGYLWTPSWPFAEYDMTLIEEPEYNEECWQTVLDAAAEGGEATTEDPCGFPAVDVNKVVSPELAEAAPHIVELLENYESNMELTNAALLYISENDATPDEAAEWWLQEYEDVWSEWVPEDIATSVSDSLE